MLKRAAEECKHIQGKQPDSEVNTHRYKEIQCLCCQRGSLLCVEFNHVNKSEQVAATIFTTGIRCQMAVQQQ